MGFLSYILVKEIANANVSMHALGKLQTFYLLLLLHRIEKIL